MRTHTAAALVAAAGLAGSAAATTVHGAVIFTRHGDRTTKWYKAQALTSLGARQNYEVGSAFRQRYLGSSSPDRITGLSADAYVSSQVFASAPDQGILMNTATAFLQGLYPPLGDGDGSASGAVNSTAPLGGYQYAVVRGVGADSPDTIWIRGDEDCPAFAASSRSFTRSADFAERDAATRDLYASLYDVLAPGVYNLGRGDLTYRRAYDIYDLVNVARIHNATSPARNVSDADLARLRTLADSAELGLNWNVSEPARSIGGQTLAGAVLRQLLGTVASRGAAPALSVMAGSYDTFLSFFGLAGLLDVSPDFGGLPAYASAMAFELVSDGDGDAFPANADTGLRVRWLFRNGTAGELTPFALFASGEASLPWPRFAGELRARAVTDAGDWCTKCASTAVFCPAVRDGGASRGRGRGAMSRAVAGVVGATVTLGIVAVAAGLLGLLLLRRRGRGRRGALSVRSSSSSAGAGGEGPNKA